MSGNFSMSGERIEQIRNQIDLALADSKKVAGTESVVVALESARGLLNSLAKPVKHGPAPTAQSIEYTLEDDACAPHGRQIDIRVYYHWDDYNPADEPFPIWGARVEDIEVLDIRYFDEQGNVVPLTTHHQELAWALLARDREAVTQACTDEGCRQGIGRAHPLYTPSRRSAALPSGSGLRMAPSERTREQVREQRKSM